MRKKMLALLLTGVISCISVTNVFAASSDETKYISTTEFGKLTGRTWMNKLYEKYVHIDVTTEKKPAHFYLKYDIKYYTTGEPITGAITLKDCNVSSTGKSSSEDVEMHHWRNSMTNKYDGFMNTKITAYTTHEARGNTAKCVYITTSY